MRIPIAVIAAFLLLACHNESPTAPPGPPNSQGGAILIGRTIDPQGAPVPRVTVSVVNTAGNVTSTVVSGDDGSFRFEDLQVTVCGLMVSVNGGNAEPAGSIRLRSGINTRDVLVSNCKIPYGTVRDASTGRGIGGAKVTIYSRETVTDANGHYQIDFGCGYVAGSTIVMKAEHRDYETAQMLSRASYLCTCSYDFVLQRR